MRRLRGLFGDVLCEIHVAAASATPYLVDPRKNAVTWFPDSNGRPVEFRSGSASESLAWAVGYLEKHVGPQSGKLSNIAGDIAVAAPKIPPATIG